MGALQPLLRGVVDKYAYQAADGNFVFCWDFGRYMNHCCEPTSRGVGDAFEVAIRDIAPGDELTCEYGTLNLLKPMTCYCGAPSCRGVIRRDDTERHFERWDDEATSAFALSHTVAQPLLPYAKIGARDLPLLEALKAGHAAQVPSARDYHIVDAPGEAAARRGTRRSMIHPDTRLVTIDGVVGSGVVATRLIPRGTITWVMDDLDRAFSGADMDALPPGYDELLDRWTFHDGRGRRVLCWDLGPLHESLVRAQLRRQRVLVRGRAARHRGR